MNIAVIKTGGKQYLVKEGSVLNIETTAGATVGGELVFDQVLLTDDGSKTDVGAPFVSGAKVSSSIVEVGRAAKKIVVKYKARSRYLKKRGHRQPFVKVKIGKV